MRITLDPARDATPSTDCSLCTGPLAAPVAAMQSVPAILGCAANGDPAADRFVDFNVYVCDACGLIQTSAGFDQGAYEVVHSHAVGGVWERHRERLAAFAQSIAAMQANAPRILEIGPSINPVARLLTAHVAAGPRTGPPAGPAPRLSARAPCSRAPAVSYIDAMPAPPFDLAANERYVAGAFPGAASALFASPVEQGSATGGHGGPLHRDRDRGFDLVIASHVAEHASNLRAFVAGLFDALTPGGTAILSIPDFRAWFEGRYWNAVTSEHLNYPFASQIETLCDELDLTAGFERLDGHSLFISLRRGRTGGTTDIRRSATETRTLLVDWIAHIQATTERIERALLDRQGEVIVAGASHLAQYLTMMSGVVGSRARCVIDNAPSKHGARLYGTSLRVAPFDVVAGRRNALVVIPPSPYRDEMEGQVRSLNPDAVVVS